MRSSDFERLGDWQRKQAWGFEDALSDLVRRTPPKSNVSYCIFTDRNTLERKNSKPKKQQKTN